MSRPVQIPYTELDITSTRSRGPGGQNVNKTNSAVIIRWNLFRTAALTEEERERARARLSNLLNEEGDILVRSDIHRDQIQNKQACIDKLNQMVSSALHVPKKRFKTKPKRSSVEKRLKSKRQHSEIKQNRSRRPQGED